MKIITIIGARPQFVKAAVLSREIKSQQYINEVIIHTGQHYDKNMSETFFTEMEIPTPNYKLKLKGSSHGAMTGGMISDIEEILIKEKPDYVLVYGDTNTTLAGSLAAVKLHIPIIHIESGLRSHDLTMPEEVNRILTDKISKYLFCPTETAINNLKNEGIINSDKQIVQNVGDIMYDAVLHYKDKAKQPEIINAKEINNFILCTIHRQSNTDDTENLKNIINSLNLIAEEIPVVLPLHPRTNKKIQELHDLTISPNLHICTPVSYFEMLYLLQHCKYVVTDSGGLQKEAYFFKKPCLVLRNTTEWVELLENKAAILSPTNKIYDYFNQLSQLEINTNHIYGHGNTGESIVNTLSV